MWRCGPRTPSDIGRDLPGAGACLVLASLLAALVSPGAARAGPACANADAVIFYCKLQGSSREVSVCDGPNGTYQYRYGRPGQVPELALDRTASEVTYTPWNGVGNAFWASLEFRNKGYGYLVAYSQLKDPDAPLEGILEITKGEKSLALKTCAAGTVINGLEELEDRF